MAHTALVRFYYPVRLADGDILVGYAYEEPDGRCGVGLLWDRRSGQVEAFGEMAGAVAYCCYQNAKQTALPRELPATAAAFLLRSVHRARYVTKGTGRYVVIPLHPVRRPPAVSHD